MKIRLSKPYLGDKAKLRGYLEEIFENGFLTQGEYVARLEKNIAAVLGVKYAVAVSSGTSALHLSLIALGITQGDEVIVPAYTFPATANVVELVGAKAVLVDVDPATYNIDTEKIESVITKRTRAIMPVHLFGNPADMDAVMRIADARGLAVIEDAAGAFGSRYKGRMCGSLGCVGCFSFHPRKIIATGEGGMVVTNDEAVAHAIRSLRNHGIEAIGVKYDFTRPGFNYRMNELEAALGAVQVDELDAIVRGRQALAAAYRELLGKIPGVRLQTVASDCQTVWQAFVVRFNDCEARAVIDRAKSAGIECTIGTYAVHLLKYYAAKYGYGPADFAHAADLYKTAVALPFYNGLAREDVRLVVDVIAGALR